VVTPLHQQFLNHEPGEYSALLRFIRQHPQIANDFEIAELGREAIQHEKAGDDGLARRCLHHTILLSLWQKEDRPGSFLGRLLSHDRSTSRAASEHLENNINLLMGEIKARNYLGKDTRSFSHQASSPANSRPDARHDRHVSSPAIGGAQSAVADRRGPASSDGHGMAGNGGRHVSTERPPANVS
jgi:hypothetical protein